MGCNSTFKKRRHNYKGALGLEIKVRGIVTNYVVYYFNLLHASRKLVEKQGAFYTYIAKLV